MEALTTVRKGRRPPRAHPQRERAYARPTVLAAARILFKNEAYASISLERIAAAALVSRHTLNNHFASKEEIFRLSREALLTEISDFIPTTIPAPMDVHDGVKFYLETCYAVFSTSANSEVMISIIRDGRHHPWLVDLHQKQIRARLIQCCETFLLYHADRDDEMFMDIRILAEQLTALAESLAYGPYYSQLGASACSMTGRSRSIAAAARSIDALLSGRNAGCETHLSTQNGSARASI